MQPEHLAHSELVLDNGLRLIAIAQPHLHRVQIAMHVRVGSRFETKKLNGISHFLEHMLYRGTEELGSAHAVNHAFESLGGVLFASTQVDHGIMSLALPPESMDAALPHFANVLTSPVFRDIEVEKGIVCEEILEDLDDEGRQVDADNLSRELVYGTHPLGFTITGTTKTVKGFTVPELRKHHARHYTAPASVVAIAGPIDPRYALDRLREHFDAFPQGEPVAAEAPPFNTRTPRFLYVENVSSQTELRICYRAFAESDPRRRPTEMLLRILDDGMSTRLYHRICDAQGLCYDVHAGYDGYEDDGLVELGAGVQHARASKVASEMIRIMKDLAEHGPTTQELEKARRRLGWELTSLLDSPEDIAGHYADSLLFNRFQTLADRYRSLVDVTAEDIREVAQEIIEPRRLHVVAVGLLERDEKKRLRDVVLGETER